MSRVWRVLKTAGKGRGEKSEPSCRELWKHSPQRGDIWGGGRSSSATSGHGGGALGGDLGGEGPCPSALFKADSVSGVNSGPG